MKKNVFGAMEVLANAHMKANQVVKYSISLNSELGGSKFLWKSRPQGLGILSTTRRVSTCIRMKASGQDESKLKDDNSQTLASKQAQLIEQNKKLLQMQRELLEQV